MTDITELALLVSKAKTSVFTLEYISQFEPADIDSDDVDLRFEVDGRDTGTNVSIVDECGQAARVIGALVEALEKAQAKNALVAGGIEAATKLHERIAELESEVKFPGVMRCNKCGFSRSHVIATPGGMRAGESTPARCPNGCGPLWHDTYRRQYNELYDAYKELESRTVTVKLPKPISVLHRREFTEAHCAIYAYPEAEVNAALDDSGIKWEAE
ncbi:hypothetical protein AAHT98_15625 [Klebsiella pneumoniae]|nr:hypothetical protein [Klebsiella pneumoniae]HDU8885995.1 hypothetical protein [Klebsiella pneumoniae]